MSVAERISVTHPAVKTLLGVDVFLHWRGAPNVLGPQLEALNGDGLELTMISNRGVKVYPDGMPETFCTDHWRCRFVGPEAGVDLDKASYQAIGMKQVLQMMQLLGSAGVEIIKTENLYLFDGVRGFSLGQGE